MKLIQIVARDLPDAWFQAVYAAIQEGREFPIDQGSYAGSKRLEFDYITIVVKDPCFGEPHKRLPELPAHYNIPDPVNPDYVFGGPTHVDKESEKPLRTYVEYLMTATKEKNESYTYGERLVQYPVEAWIKKFWDKKCAYNVADAIAIPPQILELTDDEKKIVHLEDELWNNDKIIKTVGIPKFMVLDQIEYAIWRYKKSGFRNNQVVLQVAHPNDMLIQDPPCLRQIDTRIQDGKLHFIIDFRSWDLWSGFPANLAAFTVLMEYMASEIGVETGEFVCSSKGLHLYNYVWELAEVIRGKTMKEFREERNEMKVSGSYQSCFPKS